MSNKELSVETVLMLVRKHVQWQREEGETDLRSTLWFIDAILEDYRAGKTEEEILSKYADEEEDDE